MKRLPDYEPGRRIGRLTVLSRALDFAPYGRPLRAWNCVCDCGRELVIHASVLGRASGSRACKPCTIRARCRTHGDGSRGSMAPEFTVWRCMIRRCTKPQARDYPRYGGRGIRVFPDWIGRGGYELFLAHIGRKPTPQHSIDRIDNERGYEPGNVRWATVGEQNRNRRSTIKITLDGRTQCLKDWCRELGVSYRRASKLLAQGKRAEEVLAA